MSLAASLDCREYQAAKRRQFRPYSLGHRLMYETPLTLMTRSDRSRERFAILEAGFGIGFGLDRMVETGVIGRYVGYEPDNESFAYVAERHGKRDGIELRHAPFEATDVGGFDHAFCIEVIEHVPPEKHQGFLVGLRKMTVGTLWLSTPDKARSAHGVRTVDAWLRFIRAAGFHDVTVHQEQWTTLYVCQ